MRKLEWAILDSMKAISALANERMRPPAMVLINVSSVLRTSYTIRMWNP